MKKVYPPSITPECVPSRKSPNKTSLKFLSKLRVWLFNPVLLGAFYCHPLTSEVTLTHLVDCIHIQCIMVFPRKKYSIVQTSGSETIKYKIFQIKSSLYKIFLIKIDVQSVKSRHQYLRIFKKELSILQF